MVFRAFARSNVCAGFRSLALLRNGSRNAISAPLSLSSLKGVSAIQHISTFLRLERESAAAAAAPQQDYEFFNPLDADVEANEFESESPEFGNDGPVIPWSSHKDRLDPILLNGIHTIFKYKNMTQVQDAIVSQMPITKDLLVRSKTGTGKTLGFLVPAIQRTLEKYRDENINQKIYAKERTSIFIVSPTRELATQIAMEARRLTACTSGFKTNCVYGGDKKLLQLRRLMRERNDIIVGTPGRIIDFLESEPFFKGLVQGVHTLILDEADTLLDMGFSSDIERIQSYLPKDKATFMFSATVKPQIKKIAAGILRPGYEFVDTVGKDQVDVHEQVKQSYIIRDITEHLPCVLSLLISEQMKKPEGKVIVFLQTTKAVELYANIFKALRRLYHNDHFQQFSMHSGLTQDRRNKTSDAFRKANVGSVLFTSDISARGVDYPGVTKVIQVGAPSSRDLYIHRVGRTGRAGKNGEAILLLSPFEKGCLANLHGIPVTEQILPDSEIELGPAEKKIFDLAFKYTDPEDVERAFAAYCGYLIPKRRDWYGGVDVDTIISALQNWALSFGLESPPQVSAGFLMKIGAGGHRSSNGRGDFGRGRDSGFGGERTGGFQRRDSGFGGERTGGFQRRDSGFGGERTGGFQRREGGFGERTGGFQKREGGFGERTGGFQKREGGFGERTGGFQRREGGFGERTGGFQKREGGFGERTGGFQKREGGFGERTGGFQKREGGFGERTGGFQKREGGFGERRMGVFSPNRDSLGGNTRGKF